MNSQLSKQIQPFFLRLNAGLNALFSQLWLSVSSINFYHDVYKNYRGYGIKYLFTISFISSVIYCLFVFNYLSTLRDFFAAKVPQSLSYETENIEYILQQLPNIDYDGSNISLEEDQAIYLYDKNNNKVAAIDIKNQLGYNDRSKIPIIFSKDKIILKVIEVADKKKSDFNIEYSMIFGTIAKVLTNEVIKKDCAEILLRVPKIFIYIGMPVIIFFRFITILFEKSFIVILIYLLTSFFGPKASMKTSIRMVMFASGVPVLLQPIILLIMPGFKEIIFILQMFTNFLLFLALLQIKKETNQF